MFYDIAQSEKNTEVCKQFFATQIKFLNYKFSESLCKRTVFLGNMI